MATYEGVLKSSFQGHDRTLFAAMNIENEGPLTDAEIKELDQFLLDAEGIDDSMDVLTLDGFLTAIVCGPKTILPSVYVRMASLVVSAEPQQHG